MGMTRSRGTAGVRRRRLLAHLAVVLPLGAAGLAAQALAAAPAAQAAATTFNYTGGEQVYPVPSGASAVAITAVGAPGGPGSGATPRAVADGASVTATVPLPAGTTTLYVEVGGPGVIGVFGSGASGGFNGGGASGQGGSGGGASDVRTCSRNTCTNLSANDTRLVVAGGGGGQGAAEGCGGGGGGTAGDNTVTGPGNGGEGLLNSCGAPGGGNGGFGGTSGGTGGAGSSGPFASCTGGSGSPGQGGDADPTCNLQSIGGAGGGGYYGGGGGGSGGASGGGGGAGSSFWASGATGTPSMSEDTTGVPGVQITPVITGPALALTDTAPATVLSGSSYHYTLTASNTGVQTATSTVVTDTLPGSIHFNTADTTQGSCRQKAGTVTCTVGSLAPGASATVTIKVTATKPGTVSDSAQATASNITAGRAAASAPVTVQGD